MRAALLCVLCASALYSASFRFRELNADSLELTEAGKPVFVYNHGMVLKPGVKENFRRSSYLHPVWAPDGAVVSDDFPADHLHHRGISWTWPVVKVGGETCDLWAIIGIHQKFVRWLERRATDGSALLGVENGWYVGERKVLKETVEIEAHAAGGGRRVLNFSLAFDALQPIEISGRPEKGYGGFTLRFAPRTDTLIRTDGGIEPKDTDHVKHPWAELEGNFAGRRAGARIEIDSSNSGAPNTWCLRHYGYLGVNYPGLETRTLEPGRPLKLKYRVIVFSRD